MHGHLNVKHYQLYIKNLYGSQPEDDVTKKSRNMSLL